MKEQDTESQTGNRSATDPREDLVVEWIRKEI